MARIVYDPTEDRKAKKGVKVFNVAPKQGEKSKTIAYDSVNSSCLEQRRVPNLLIQLEITPQKWHEE